QDDMQAKKMENDATKADYEKYFDAKLEMDYRNSTIKALDLTKEEVIAFDPIFNNYMEKMQKLEEKKMKLIADLKEELEEDDSEANEMEDRTDFVENYWEVEIDEMRVRKNYFDVLEDKIAKEKAMKFFLWEDFINKRMKQQTMYEFFPIVIEVEGYGNSEMNSENKSWKNSEDDRMGYTNDSEADKRREEMTSKGASEGDASNRVSMQAEKLNDWVSSNQGKVNISHEYTYDGLTHVLTTLEAMNSAGAIDNDSFDREKERIMNMAAKLKENTYSDGHADIAREALIATARLIPDSQELAAIARKIDKEVLMTKQASVIYDFFEQANEKLQRMSKDYAAKSNDKSYNANGERK
ncbi:MAG: hypothetical protein AAGG68_29000, partial [Bacteroidota bacterium]